MLLVDSDVISAADLIRLDSEVTPAAATAAPPITVDGPGSVCEQAWSECVQRILGSIQSYACFPAQSGGVAGHQFAINDTGASARTQSRVRLNQMVVSDYMQGVSQSPFQAWMAYHALSILFRDVSARMGKDRYKEKYTRYEANAEDRWRTLRNNGLPTVVAPLEAPGAKHAFRAGSWSAANITSSPGGTNAAPQQVLVAITWYDASLYTSRFNPPQGDFDPQHNAESGPSALLNTFVPPLSLLAADITSLSPPNGSPDATGLSQIIVTPLNATHWNIYAGKVPAANVPPTLYLQQEGIPIGTKQAVLAADPVYGGPVLSAGQYPNYNSVFLNVVMRA